MDVSMAEKEASEVLHSLLSVARVQAPDDIPAQKEFAASASNWNEQIYVLQPDQSECTDEHEKILLPIDEEFSETAKGKKNKLSPQKKPKALALPSDPTSNQKFKKNSKICDDDNRIEANAQAVRARFQLGCDCSDDSCFRGLNPESVYKHRLNIAELTKEEHDMYLMGVTMACLGDLDSTVKRKARQRLRSTYVHHGRKVCLSAFLYLENCTLYQLKRIRKHLIVHGVTPRVHGNHGKKPHNVFSLDIYQRATNFLKNYIKKYSNSGSVKVPVSLPADVTRKTIHKQYEAFVRPLEEKVMGYSTFRHFMKEQFPQVRFSKTDIIGQNLLNQNSKLLASSSKSQKSNEPLNNSIEDVVVLTTDWNEEGQAFIVTPMQEIVSQQFVYQSDDMDENNVMLPI